MYDTVLVPTDGSDHATRAARHAAAIADAFDAALHVVSVVDVQAASGVFNAGGVDPAFVERLEGTAAEAIETVDAALDRAADHTEVLQGRPADAIAEYVTARGVDVVAMGTHGRSGVDRVVLGSVTERVLRSVDVPVLTTRAASDDDPVAYRDVLVPSDGSDPASVALDHGIAIADRFDARLTGLHVLQSRALGGVTVPSDVLATLEDAGEAITHDVVERATAAGIEARGEIREGRPGDVITAFADEAGMDLVVMGTAGRTGIDRFLLGSTATRVLRQAGVPVMAVPPGDAS